MALVEDGALLGSRQLDMGSSGYSQGTGRAAALVPTGDGGTLEVAAALGMRWRPGKVVSERSVRGLRLLKSTSCKETRASTDRMPGLIS